MIMKTEQCKFSPLGLAVAIGITSLNIMAVDPDLPYSSPSSGADGALRFRAIPVPGRNSISMAYDTERKQTVLFGGYSPTTQGDTWVLDTASDAWREVTPLNSAPP